MIVVLAVIGLAISKVSSMNDQSNNSSPSSAHVVAPLSEVYEKGIQTFVNGTLQLLIQLKALASSILENNFLL